MINYSSSDGTCKSTEHFLSFLFQVIHFTAEDVATFIAVLGVLSVISQVIILIK